MRWGTGQPPGMAVHRCRARWAWAPLYVLLDASRATTEPLRGRAAAAQGRRRTRLLPGARNGRRRARAAPRKGTCPVLLPRPRTTPAVPHPAPGGRSGRVAFRRRVPYTVTGLRGSGRIRSRCELGSSTAGGKLWAGDFHCCGRARERTHARPLALRARHSRFASRRPFPAVQGRSSAAAWLPAVVVLSVVAGASAQPSWQNGVTAW